MAGAISDRSNAIFPSPGTANGWSIRYRGATMQIQGGLLLIAAIIMVVNLVVDLRLPSTQVHTELRRTTTTTAAGIGTDPSRPVSPNLVLFLRKPRAVIGLWVFIGW